MASARSPLPPVVHLDLGCEFRGGQRQVLYLAAGQAASGRDVRIASPSGAPILERAAQQGLPLLPLPGRRDFDPRNILALVRMLPPGTILHTHDARAASLGALAAWARRDLHLIHTRRVSYPLGSGWSRLKYRRAGLVACVSVEVEEAVRRAGVASTTVIPSAIVLSRYAPRRPGNNGRMGIIGALSPQKGHAQFLEALALMPDPPEVWIVGNGALEAELRAQSARLGLERRIVWKGEVESPRVLPLLDLLAVPSAHGEGSSGVIKEGWASAVPVVCSDLPANLELVRDGDNGLVFANGDPRDLARQLTRLLAEAGLCERLAAAGLASVARYDAACMCGAYDQAYSALTASRA